jgi:polyhydroxybutyrate depolymerase
MRDGVVVDSVVVDGRTRTFTVVGDRGPDLVLVFHGSRQTGAGHREFTGRSFDTLASEGTAVVAYLDGHKGNWNDARRTSRFPARLENVDDVGFARAVVRKLAASHGVDTGRVFAAGYSNGGQMVIRLIHEDPGLLAGAVIVAAPLPAPDDFVPAPSTDPVRPMPVVLIHGTADRITRYGGGRFPWWAKALFKVGGHTLSVPQTAEHFAGRNHITVPPVVTELPATGSTSIERTAYREPGRPPVTLYTVRGGGHTIPGPADAPAVLGRTNHDISAAALIADLLRARV